MPRKLLNWIDSYLEFVEKNSESPLSFHTWGAISCISAALQRKVYIRRGHTKIYPNQYIVLVGPSALARKAEPVTIISEFLRELGIPMIGEDNSQESIIRDMRNAVTTYKEAGTEEVKFQCAVCATIEELAVFTGYQNSTFLAYLTNWYDSRDQWKRSTKHQGKDDLDGVCFNLFASTAPDWLPHILPKEAAGGGLTSRILFIVEGASDKMIPDPDPPDESLRQALLHDLEYINSMSGEMHFSDKARDLYIKWYEEEWKRIRNGAVSFLYNPMFFGYLGRKQTHIKKLCMIMAAARGNTLQIRSEDFLRAKSLLSKAEKRMPSVFKGMGKSRYSEETDSLIEMVQNKKTVRRSEILKFLRNKIDATSLEAISKTLEQMKFLKITRPAGSDDLVYTLIESPLRLRKSIS